MRSTIRFWRMTLAIAGAIAIPHATAGEERVAIKDLPAAVTGAVTARFTGARLSEAVKETENGRLTYEVSIRHEGREHDVALLADGKILEIESEISEKALPAAVAQALAAAHPGARIREISELTDVEKGESTPSTYEVLIKEKGGKVSEVSFSRDGRVVEDDEDDTPGEHEEDD